MKSVQTVLDLHNDKVTMFGKPVDVQFTSNGHKCMNIKDRKTGQINTLVNEEEIQKILDLDSLRKKEGYYIKAENSLVMPHLNE